MKHTASTMMVSRTASRRVGQTTFLSSAMVSAKNPNLKRRFFVARTLVIRGYLVSLCNVWVRHRGQYFFNSSRCGSFLLFLVVV